MTADINEVGRSWRIWWILALQDIELRYKRSMLGPFWISLSMTVFILTVGFLYSQIFNRPLQHYLMWYGPSVLIWNLLLGFVIEGASSTLEHSSLIENVPTPIPVAATRTVMRNLIIFAHNAVPVLVMVFILSAPKSANFLLLVPGVALITIIGWLVAVILGPLSARYRDIPQVVGSFMQIAFFLSPILWQPSQGRVSQAIVQINPIYHIVELGRAPLQDRPIEASTWAYIAGLVVILSMGAWLSIAASRSRVSLWL